VPISIIPHKSISDPDVIDHNLFFLYEDQAKLSEEKDNIDVPRDFMSQFFKFNLHVI